jgi:fluoride exporter
VTALVIAGAALLGGLGSVARVLLDGAVSPRAGGRLPLGILAVNVTGAFALGVLFGAGAGADGLRLAGVGLLGGYTTFSTWMLDSDRLAEDGHARVAVANVLVSLALGLVAVWLGRELGLAL